MSRRGGERSPWLYFGAPWCGAGFSTKRRRCFPGLTPHLPALYEAKICIPRQYLGEKRRLSPKALYIGRRAQNNNTTREPPGYGLSLREGRRRTNTQVRGKKQTVTKAATPNKRFVRTGGCTRFFFSTRRACVSYSSGDYTA